MRFPFKSMLTILYLESRSRNMLSYLTIVARTVTMRQPWFKLDPQAKNLRYLLEMACQPPNQPGINAK